MSINNGSEASSYLIDIEGKLWAAGSDNRNFHNTNSSVHRKYDPWGSENVKVKQAWSHSNQTNSSYTSNVNTDVVLLEDGRLFLQGNQQGVYQYWRGAGYRANGWYFNQRFDPAIPLVEDIDFYQGAAGSYTNFLAIKKDKTVITLGHSPINSSGTNQNTTFEPLLTTPTSPQTKVTDVEDIISIGGRYGSCYALRTSTGLVYVIGYSSKGQKGTGSTDQGATPLICQPAKLPQVEQLVMTGYAHEATTDTCLIARCTNGDTYHWGYNANNNLADGTSSSHIYAPVQVKF